MSRHPAITNTLRPALPGLRAWLFCLLCLGGGLARGDDAGGLFLDAYLLREEGMKAEKSGDFKTAYEQYRASARIYDQVARDFPDWKPEMVAFRRKGMTDQINAVAERAAKMAEGRTAGDTRPLPPAVARDLAKANPAGQPRGATVAKVPVSPQPNPAGPSVIARPPAAAAKGAEDPYARLRIQELERQQAGARQTMELLAKERDALKSRLVEVENNRNLSQYEARKFREERDTARKQLQDLQESGINRTVAEKAKISELEARIARADKERAAAEKRVAEADERTAKAQAGTADAVARAKAEATAAARAEMAGDRTKEEQVATALRKEREEVAGRLAAIEAELAASRRDTRQGEENLRIMTAERDRWKAERDQLAERLASTTTAADMVRDNQKLEKQLADARARLAELQAARQADAAKIKALESDKADDAGKIKAMLASRAEDAEKIRQLRDQVEQVEKELAKARKENAAFRDQMVALERRLGEAQTALDAAAAAANAADNTSMAEENRTLKEMVIRQLRQQAYRSRARNLLLRELAKLEINSKSMLQYIDQLEGKSSLPTPDEVTRIDDHEIRALAGVELSGKFFQGDEPAEPDGPAAPPAPAPAADATTAAAGPANGTPAGQGTPGAPADATSGFDFQKRSLATTAQAAFLKGDFKQAEDTYRLIVEADPADLRMQCNLGVTLIKQERFGDAVGRFQDALGRDESNAFAHLMLGVCHWKLRQPELAVDRLNRCLVLEKSNPQAWLYLGLVAVDAGQWQDAETAFKKAIEAKPDYPMAHYNLAVVYTKPGFADPVQAKRAYEESLRLGGARDEAIELFLRMGPQAEPPPGIDMPPGDFPPELEAELPQL